MQCYSDEEYVDDRCVSVPSSVGYVPLDGVLGRLIPFQNSGTRDVDSCGAIITKVVFGHCRENGLLSQLKSWCDLRKKDKPKFHYFPVPLRDAADSYTGITMG